MQKNWLVKENPEKDFGEGWGYNSLLLQLFWNRGIKSKERADVFLNPEYSKLYDPFLFPDARKAVERIFDAKEKGELVFVYGDYDADGVPGAAILCKTLGAYGMAPRAYIPHRELEGYGLNRGAVDFMAKEGGKLIITCDCGISDGERVTYAKEKGVDVIVTDHHTLPPELPKDAFAIIHPQIGDYPFKSLAGGGVAFKLAQALLKSRSPENGASAEYIEKWLLDLVSISTVTDIVPLIDENRILVRYGLKVLAQTKNLGLQALIEKSGIKREYIDTYTIGFQIGPRINSAGRMDHANAAFELLMSEDKAEAEHLAENLNKSNSERQKQTEIIFQEAEYQIVKDGAEKNYCLFGFNKNWQLGLLGLAASKLSQKFYRPVILLTEIEGKIKGSARGIEQFNIIKSLQTMPELFEGYGGHPMAAGMTLKDLFVLNEFKERISKLAEQDLKNFELLSSLNIDAEINLDEIDLDTCKQIEELSPFGEANPRPLFLTKGVEVRAINMVGNGEKHLRLKVLGKFGVQYNMIGFSFGYMFKTLKLGDKIDVVYELGVNRWNGTEECQLKIVDIKKC